MHYTIDYAGLPAEVAQAKAIADIREYLGDDRFEHVTKLLRDEPIETLEAFRLAVSFAGVQGFPAEAWFKHCYAS